MTRIALIAVFLFGINGFVKATTTTNIKASYQEKIDSRYCIVVGSFSSFEKANKYGKFIQSKGYKISYRDNGKGFQRICVFDFKSEAEAQKRIDELKSKDDIFKQCWVLKYDANAAPEKPVATARPAEKPQSAPPATPVADTKKKIPEEAPKKVSVAAPVVNTKVPEEKPKKTSVTTPAAEPKASKEKPKETGIASPVVNTKTPEEKPKETSVAAPTANTKETEKTAEKEYAHYCLVVGNFPASAEAKSFGESLQTNGYGVFFRKDTNGSVLVCMYDLKTKPDTEKRMDKMRHIDGIFTKAWILGYDNITENLSIDQL